jgi:ATP-dependent DNA helicase RecQ
MKFNSSRALDLLRLGTNTPSVTFREGQEEAIRHIVEGRGRLLVVQKTGWGKSLVYFIATKLLRENGSGLAILISPLLALMRNQIAAAQRLGIRAVTINSDNQDEWNDIERSVRAGQVDILLISPERLANERFRTQVLARVSSSISLLIVDEAHCISDWGHDFRPQYRLLERIIRTLPANVRLLATTATANNRVMADLREVLGPNLEISKGDLHRSSLLLQTIRLPAQAERLAWLAEQIPRLDGSGIIYTLTIRDANQVADWLKFRGLKVESYTGATGAQRELLELSLLENRVKALVATTALGMGFDKPDLAFVIHYQAPGSVVAYYQQVGRAGRALNAAYGVLLSGAEETDITDYFIDSAFPTRDEAREILEAIELEPRGLSVYELMAQVNLSKKRIETTIELLALESPAPIAKLDSKWQLTPSRLKESFWQRTERLTALRKTEQQQMQDYVRLRTSHMNFLIQALDGDDSATTTPDLPLLPTRADPVLVHDAISFLRRTSLDIEARKMWPSGGLPNYKVKGRIQADDQFRTGKVLCVWGDAGWGDYVRKGKYEYGRFGDELVTACEQLVRNWNPQPALSWITCVPSLRHPDLVPDFARRLARKLDLPFVEVIEKTDDRPEQKTMANGTKQALNIDGAFAINRHVPAGSVLLVDDMVDSRWTLTVCSWLLRTHGSGEVFPLGLALTNHS